MNPEKAMELAKRMGASPEALKKMDERDAAGAPAVPWDWTDTAKLNYAPPLRNWTSPY